MEKFMPELLTTREVADLLRIKERKVYDLVASGTLPHSKVIGKLLFPRDAIKAWLAENTVSGIRDHAPRRPDVFLGSHDPLLEHAVRQSRCRLATLFDSSQDGLARFAAGAGIAAGIHIPDQRSDSWNVEAVSELLSGDPLVLVEFARRSRGIALAPDKAVEVDGISGLRGLRFAPRQKEAGSQILFERLLRDVSLELEDLAPRAPQLSEHDVVQDVANGKADACFALECIAREARLSFIGLLQERFDLLVDRRAWFEPPFQRFLAWCRTPAFEETANELGGYDVSGFGTVHFNGG
jgi:putative molybdopterin biosynthesis protein